jgi:predicted nucleic acid-binding protein
VTRYAIDAAALLRIVEDQLEVHPDHQLVAPQGVRSQALTTLLQRVRAGELSDQQARALHTRLTETRIRALGDRVSRWTSYQVAREQGWDDTTDAEYVAVTRLQADALVALDPGLRSKADGLVPLAELEALLAPE